MSGNKNSIKHKESQSPQKKFLGRRTALQKKYIAGALVVLLSGGYIANQLLKDKDKENIENVKNIGTYPFEKHQLNFWDNNTDFFTKNLQYTKETIAPGVNIIRDAGLVFYVVQEGDNLDKIRRKLMVLPEFSYLKRAEYDRTNPNTKTKSFNIPADKVTKGLYIPIPLDSEVRKISPKDFANYCHEAIMEMQNDSTGPYFNDINQLLANTSEKDLIISMLTFARSETSAEYTSFVQPLGEVELHRREPRYKSFSFTYFHILMEKNADGKTPGPGLKAREKLGLTEGQCYHPKNAAKLFLGYRIEKTNGNLANILPLTKDNLIKVGTMYNGSQSYATKLKSNFNYTTKLMHGKIKYYDDSKLKEQGFIYTGLNSNDQHIYKIKTSKDIKDIKDIVNIFNRYKAKDCPAINENNIVNESGQPIKGKIILDTVYIKVNKEK